VWGLSTVEAGLGIVPMAGTVVTMSFRVGHLPARVGFRPPLAIGATLIAIGLVINAGVETGHVFRPVWVLVAIVIGTGIALCYLLLGAAAVANTAPSDLAAVTALNQCARQLGAALGVASAVAAIGTHAHSAAHFHLAWLICAGFSALAAICAAALGREVISRPYLAWWGGRRPGRRPCGRGAHAAQSECAETDA
jgi:MFS family permease